MRQSIKTFALASGVTASLLVIGLLPSISIGGIRLRRVDLLSDIRPAASPAKGVADTLQVIEATRTDEWPDSILPIEDYSQGNPGGMAHFYDMAASVHTLGRPVRIAVLGDSFFGADHHMLPARASAG